MRPPIREIFESHFIFICIDQPWRRAYRGTPLPGYGANNRLVLPKGDRRCVGDKPAKPLPRKRSPTHPTRSPHWPQNPV